MLGALSTLIKWTFTATLWNCYLHMARQFVRVLMKVGTLFTGTCLCPGVGTTCCVEGVVRQSVRQEQHEPAICPLWLTVVMWTRFWPSKLSSKYLGAFTTTCRVLWQGMSSLWKDHEGFCTDTRQTTEGTRAGSRDAVTVLGWRWWRLALWLSDGILGTESSTRGTGWHVSGGYDTEESGLIPRILAWAAEGKSCNLFRRLQGKEQFWRQNRSLDLV